MKKKAAEIIIKMADEHGNVLFEETEFCKLYEKANKYVNKLIGAKLARRRKKQKNSPLLTDKEIDDIVNSILN